MALVLGMDLGSREWARQAQRMLGDDTRWVSLPNAPAFFVAVDPAPRWMLRGFVCVPMSSVGDDSLCTWVRPLAVRDHVADLRNCRVAMDRSSTDPEQFLSEFLQLVAAVPPDEQAAATQVGRSAFPGLTLAAAEAAAAAWVLGDLEVAGRLWHTASLRDEQRDAQLMSSGMAQVRADVLREREVSAECALLAAKAEEGDRTWLFRVMDGMAQQFADSLGIRRATAQEAGWGPDEWDA